MAEGQFAENLARKIGPLPAVALDLHRSGGPRHLVVRDSATKCEDSSGKTRCLTLYDARDEQEVNCGVHWRFD